MKINPLIITLFLTLTTLNANETTYELIYSSKDQNCTLTKDKKPIALFDKKFKREKPRNSYTCSAIQKVQYNECIILETKNTTAISFSYGSYGYTNLIAAFKNPTKHTDSHMKLKCTATLTKIKTKK